MRVVTFIFLKLTLFFSIGNAQNVPNNFCSDITSKISIEKVDETVNNGYGNRILIEMQNQDTLKFTLRSGNFKILKAVMNKEETLINIVFVSLKSKNMINFRGIFKKGNKWPSNQNDNQRWRTEVEYQSMSFFEDWSKVDNIEDIYFPDIHTILIKFMTDRQKTYERLYRITQFGIVEYDRKGTTSEEREEWSIGYGKYYLEKRALRPRH